VAKDLQRWRADLSLLAVEWRAQARRRVVTLRLTPTSLDQSHYLINAKFHLVVACSYSECSARLARFVRRLRSVRERRAAAAKVSVFGRIEFRRRQAVTQGSHFELRVHRAINGGCVYRASLN